jgi:hypothetical protein
MDDRVWGSITDAKGAPAYPVAIGELRSVICCSFGGVFEVSEGIRGPLTRLIESRRAY